MASRRRYWTGKITSCSLATKTLLAVCGRKSHHAPGGDLRVRLCISDVTTPPMKDRREYAHDSVERAMLSMAMLPGSQNRKNTLPLCGKRSGRVAPALRLRQMLAEPCSDWTGPAISTEGCVQA